MCLKEKHEFKDDKKIERALELLQPGWAVAFDRGVYHHFCIYLGTGLVSRSSDPKVISVPEDSSKSSPVRHLICQLTKRRMSGFNGRGDIWIDDFKSAACDSNIIVYECDCPASRRAEVVEKCLKCQGETQYSLQDNNCEHFVRKMLENKSECLQTVKLNKLFKDRSLPTSTSSPCSFSLEQFGLASDVFVFLLRDQNCEAVKSSERLRNTQDLLRFVYAKLYMEKKDERFHSVEFFQTSTQPRLRPETLDRYPVTSPQGFCAVININNYDDNTNLGRRSGSEHDVARIREVFGKLNFVIEVKEDLTSHEIGRFLTNLAHDERLEQHGCFVLFLMAHGSKREIVGSDGETIDLSYIVKSFRSPICKGLRGKPKIIVIQACRGMRLQFGRRDSFIDCSSDDRELRCYSPRDNDFLVCFASGGDAVAFRYENTGSCYVQALCREIETHCQSDHILDIVTRVNHAVWRAPVQQGELQLYTAPEFTSSLTKKYYLS